MPRQGSVAPRTRFGLVNHVVGGGSPGDSGYDKRAPSIADCPGHSDYDNSFSDDCADAGFAPYDVLATQGHGGKPCWNPSCGRVHNGVVWYALCGGCWTFQPGSRRCQKYTMISSPNAPKCPNWSRGFLGTADEFDEPMADCVLCGVPRLTSRANAPGP